MKRQAIANAKTIRPVQTDIYPRERLFSVLDERLERPVTWVTGPGGSGKTTFVSSYVESRQLPCLWYQVDQGDNDIATFFYYLGQAALQAAPRRKKPLPLLTREYLLGITEFTYSYFEELFSRLKSPSLLVLDNYQEIAEGSELHQVILNGLTRLPVGINLVIISRLGPVPAFSRLKANRQMETVGWDNLRLSMDEFTGIADMRENGKVARSAMKQLYQRLDGWVAGLVLLLENSRVMGGKLEPLEDFSAEDIFDYFAEEIMRKIQPEYRDFYFQTSFLPRMSPEMAERITGNHRAGQILNYLHTNYIFTEKHDRNPPLYQYHPLFRQFLQTMVANQYGRDGIRNLQRDAADILTQHEMHEDAARLYTEASDWVGLKKLILQTVREMTEQGRHQVVQDWICRMPDSEIEKDPWIDYWLGVCLIPFEPAAARENLTRAYPAFLDREDAEGAFLAWSRIVESYITEWSDFAPLDYWIEELERILEHFGDFPTRDAEARAVTGMFSALIYRQPSSPRLPLWEERTRALMASTTDQFHQILLANQLLHFYGWMGSLPKGGMVLKELKDRIRRRDVEISPLARIFVHSLDAVYDCFTGAFESSMEAVRKGLKEATSTGVHIWDEMLLSYGTYVALSTGKLDTARELLKQMEKVINYGRMLTAAQYYYLTTWEALARGDVQEAQQKVDSGLAMTQHAGHPYAQAILHVGKAQTLIESGDFKPAMEELAKARRIIHPDGSDQQKGPPLIDYMCLVNESYMAVLQGHDKKALQLIGRTMSLGRKFNFISVPGGQSKVMALLCARALANGIEPEYVRTVINKRHLVPEGTSPDLESWPWPLRITTLGRFELSRDGVPVAFSGKAQAKPLALLKVLISMGGQSVPEEHITDILWPDADGDMAHRSFATTLHRLRRITGPDALILSEGRLSLSRDCCHLDLWTTESALQSAAAELESGRTLSQVRQPVEDALKLYRGQFLPAEADESWTMTMRDKLQGRYTRLLERYCKLLEEEGDAAASIQWCQEALEHHSTEEAIYRRLMGSLLSAGRKAEGLAVYDRCRRELEDSLGTEPSSSTEKIRQQLSV